MKLNKAESGSIYLYHITRPKKYEVFIDGVDGLLSDCYKFSNNKTRASANKGLHDQAYSYDNGLNWTNNNSYTFDNNSSIKVIVRDRLGNVSKVRDVFVGKIDKTKPTVVITSSTPSGSAVSVRALIFSEVRPHVTPSRYQYAWYKDGKLIENATTANYTATQSGTYRLVVTTGAGLSGSSNDFVIRVGK